MCVCVCADGGDGAKWGWFADVVFLCVLKEASYFRLTQLNSEDTQHFIGFEL